MCKRTALHVQGPASTEAGGLGGQEERQFRASGTDHPDRGAQLSGVEREVSGPRNKVRKATI